HSGSCVAPVASVSLQHDTDVTPQSKVPPREHRLRLYLALHEGADALDGRSRFRKDPRPDLPGVRHPRPYFEFDLTSGGAHPLRHAHGIIEEDLVAADLDERRRQSGRVG